MPLSFAQPLYLLLLFIAIPALLWVLRGSRAGLSAGRRRISVLLRVAGILALVFALAGLRWHGLREQLTLLFVVDRSLSVAPDNTNRALQIINDTGARMTEQHRAGVVSFADDALVEVAPIPALRLEKFESVTERNATNIAGALRLAQGLVPAGSAGRIVLLSDGNENVEDATAEAATIAATGVTVDVVALDTDTRRDAILEDVQLPAHTEERQPFDARMVVRSNFTGQATVRLFRNRALVGESTVSLTKGSNVFALPQTNVPSGFHSYEATVDMPGDALRDNNTAGGFTIVRGEPRVLLIGAAENTQALALALQREGILVEQNAYLPRLLNELETYSAVLLCDVSSEELSSEQLNILETYCGDFGGGLGMLGGPNSFGLGGYRDTPVEAALPVSMDIKDKKRFPSVGLMVLIDKSGSMTGTAGGVTKLALASEAAVAALESLGPRDSMGVIGFDSAAQWVAPFQTVDNKPAIAALIRRIRPGGGTDAIPAFLAGFDRFDNSKVALKHMIIISDGQVQPGNYGRIKSLARDGRITISGVAVGADADMAFMQDLASATGGRAYFTADPRNLPRIFTKETVITQRSYLMEETFTPTLAAPSDIVKGISGFPPLRGYVATEAKPRAEHIMKSPAGDPVLSVWQYKLGRALAFTSDARDRWAAAWLAWPEYPKFWSQAVRWIVRNRQEGVLLPRTDVASGPGILIVDAAQQDGTPVNQLALQAVVAGPENSRETVALKQVGSGRYEARFDATRPGSYLAAVQGPDGALATVGAQVSYSPELRDSAPNLIRLQEIAAAGAGAMNPSIESLFRRTATPVRDIRELWYPLLWLALALFVLDVGVRRVVLDAQQTQRLAATLGRIVPTRWMRRRRTGTVAADDSLAATLLASRKTSRKSEAPPRPEVTRTAEPPNTESRIAKEDAPPIARSAPPSPNPAPPPDENDDPMARLLAARRRTQERLRGAAPPDENPPKN